MTIRFDKETFNRIENSGRTANLSVSEYIRRMVIKGKIVVKQEIIEEVPMLKRLIGEFGKIGSNLNQIAHHYNGGGARSAAMYDRTMRAISELYSMKYEIERMGGEFFRGYSRAYSRKRSNLRQMQRYLVFQHEEHTYDCVTVLRYAAYKLTVISI